ncbi:restriction endonuclease subunit S [Acidipropionibacterium acidipropionici]|uniref:restriction endonuclease subunit S n=1 Tax=Acidipropionibacterium acidipropionici TaxID=1748 RepID=UPI001585DBF0|nr:restriction endonuclease subunit S [Acidipropionibacterium acidipropionici]
MDFYSGGTPSKARKDYWSGDFPWFSAKDMKRSRLRDSVDHISPNVFGETHLRKLSAGTIAIVVRGMILAHDLPIAVLEVESAINQDLKALIPKRELDSSYLVAMIRAQEQTILSRVATAAHGTKKLDSRVLEEIPIPFPAMEEQRRIAAILDKADSIRAKRRQALDHLDALTQSIFHDMFGQAGAAAMPLGDLVEGIENGTSPVCEARPAEGAEWGVLKLGAVTYGQFRPRENKALLEGGEELADNEVRPGDVLMTRKNTRDLVGAVALVGEVRPGLLIPDLIFRLTLRKDIIDPQYFQTLMMSPRQREQVRALSSGSAASMPNISKARLRKLNVIVPPMDQQVEFAHRVGVISRRRNEIQRVSERDDELFASLQSRAFTGEL